MNLLPCTYIIHLLNNHQALKTSLKSTLVVMVSCLTTTHFYALPTSMKRA